MTHDELQNNSSDTGTKVPMTHDELLAKIDIWKFQTKGYDDTYEVHGILNALRAVVTLCDFLDKKGRCCVPVQEIIQAIEKELK